MFTTVGAILLNSPHMPSVAGRRMCVCEQQQQLTCGNVVKEICDWGRSRREGGCKYQRHGAEKRATLKYQAWLMLFMQNLV